MRKVLMIWLYAFPVLGLLVLVAYPTFGEETNVWIDAQHRQAARKYTVLQDTTVEDPYAHYLPSFPDSLSSPYFYYRYASDFRSTRVPLTLSDQELAMFFVRNPSINIKQTLESENLFMFVPNDFKCWHLRPTQEQIEASNSPDTLYTDFYHCRANLPQPLGPNERAKFEISSSLSDEDFQAYLEIDTPFYMWRVYRRFHSTDEEVLAQIERLRLTPDVESVWVMLHVPDDPNKDSPITPNDQILVVFQDGVSEAQIQALNAKNNTEIIESENGAYTLRSLVGGGISTLEVAEKYRQDKLVLKARPLFFSWFSEPGIVVPLEEHQIFINEGKYRIDFNKSGAPDFEDFVLFAAGFGTGLGNPAFDSRFDLDGNGLIAFNDFIQFVQIFSDVE